jgi:predicted kinase
MGKVILICGKIASGKSYYAKALKEKYNAVILGTDEATYDLINNEQGDFYNIFVERVNNYLRKKAAEVAIAGANVILDWGFWTKKGREEITKYFKTKNVHVEWHYVDVDEKTWQKNIAERNKRVEKGNGGSDFYVDEGLMKKLLTMFEEPTKEEIDVWYVLNRK